MGLKKASLLLNNSISKGISYSISHLQAFMEKNYPRCGNSYPYALGGVWWSCIGISPFFDIVWPSKRVRRFCIIYRGKLSIRPLSLCVFSALWYKNRLMIKQACEKSTPRSSKGVYKCVQMRSHAFPKKACIYNTFTLRGTV